ncbi:hypothetical protein FRC06_004382 [Ceratobasidium sp. 370]|nr:hypothetical protein FRC06_004382 [Ceratobasidium sp. 370]
MANRKKSSGKAPARGSDDDDSDNDCWHNDSCKKEGLDDDYDGLAFGEDELDKDDDDDEEDEDDEGGLTAKNAKLRRENKQFAAELKAIRCMCDKAGLRELMDANVTPGAAGSRSNPVSLLSQPS